MDETDRKLIALLRDAGRTPVAVLAKSLGVSRGTVQNRMSRLEKNGTIVGYTIRLQAAAEDRGVRALMYICVQGNRTQRVITALRAEPAVSALHSTNGQWDLIAELRTQNIEAFDQVLSRIRLLEGISSSETSLLLFTFKV